MLRIRQLALILLGIIILSSLESNNLSTDSIPGSKEKIDGIVNPNHSPEFASLGGPVIDAPFYLYNTEDAFEGYNLFTLGKWNTTSGKISNYLVITDMEGNAILEKLLPVENRLSGPAEFINSTTVLFGAIEGATLWNYYTDKMVNLSIAGHHEMEWNPNDNTIFTFNGYSMEIEGSEYQFDNISEYDLDGNVVWSLDTHSFISHTQWCPYHDMWGTARDVVHSNTVFYDPEKDTILYNSRNTNTFWLINHTSSELIWAVGEYGDFALYDINGIQRDALFYHAHAIEQVTNDTFILFDNDYHNQVSPTSYTSRIVEITINIDTMTANETWVWKAPQDYWSIRWGDADRLPNGNRLGCFGTEYHQGENYGARLVEVNDAGEIVWEMSFINHDDIQYVTQRLERFRFKPILSSPSDIHVSSGEEVDASWQAWYNYRPKRNIPGEYTLYLDNVEIDAGSFKYDKLWRPVDLNFSLVAPAAGNHTLTLQISDDDGHTSNDTITIIVGDFFIYRTKKTSFEEGVPNSQITWWGYVNNSLMCNISVNGVQKMHFEWNGTPFNLDLETLTPNSYLIELAFYAVNGTIIHTESFWVEILPKTPPDITYSPSNTSVYWNQSLILIWEAYDASYTRWNISLNGVEITSGYWSGNVSEISWEMPKLDESQYEIELVLVDILNQSTIDHIFVDILPPSPGIIELAPDDFSMSWGSTDVSLEWKIHGGNSWILERNETRIGEGSIMSDYIELQIHSWQEENWTLGNYNLTLVLVDEGGISRHTSWVSVEYNTGDPYADAIITNSSTWYSFGEEALGEPDSNFASIYLDYANGYITLDMGESEEIIDGDGDDFQVISSEGLYEVYVAESLSSPFLFLGNGSGNASFDIKALELSIIRFVRIEIASEDTVKLDAINAIHFNKPNTDNGSPIIEEISSFRMLIGSARNITWIVTDETPWSYSIILNDTMVVSEPWVGNNISYYFIASDYGISNITIVVEDVFGQKTNETLLILVGDSTTNPVSTFTTGGNTNQTTPSIGPFIGITILSISLGTGCLAVLLVILYKKGKLNR